MHTAHEGVSSNSLPIEERDVEKADSLEGEVSGASTGHMSPVQTLTLRSTRTPAFTHPLSHVKTIAEDLVGFDGADDPYRPINWPFRKKVITTMLYGFTTMGSTWASSV